MTIIGLVALGSCGTEEPTPDADPGSTENAAPEINDQSFSIDENSASGTAVGTISASDPNGDEITFSITAGNTDDAFAVADDGNITVNTQAALDFETTASFELTVQVSDGQAEASASITIDLNDVDESVAGPQGCQLTSFSIESETDVYEWVRNEQNEVTMIKNTYTDEDTGNEETESLRFSYEGGKLTGAEWFSNGVFDGDILEVEYDGDNLSKIKEVNEDGEVSENRFFYTDGLLTKTEHWGDDTGSLILESTSTITMSSGNITKVSDENTDGTTDDTSFTYDDKTNPFQNDVASLLYFDYLPWYFSANNYTESVNEYDGNTDTTTIAYEYNDDGFPIKLTEEDEVINFDYSCD